jgi:hypothetical protein
LRDRTPSPAALRFLQLLREVEAELMSEDTAGPRLKAPPQRAA